MSITNKLSIVVREQLPEFIRADYDTFVAFIEAYYEYLEQTNKATDFGRNLLNYFDVDNTLTDFEEYVTLGYERNSIIYPYILNLEFLFEDSSDDFEFNRYFGMYCNTVDLAELDFDLKNKISHRSQALQKLKHKLRILYGE